MAEIALQLDDALLERLRKLARARGCSVEVLIAQCLDAQLPVEADAPDANDAMTSHWNQEEAAFLHDTVRALDEVPTSTPLVPGKATEWDKPGS